MDYFITFLAFLGMFSSGFFACMLITVWYLNKGGN